MKGQKQELASVRGKPVRCLSCGAIQIVVGTPVPGNCDRKKCQGDHVEQCGPLQLITLRVYR